jgi:DNA-binding SARP family transcriptional activator
LEDTLQLALLGGVRIARSGTPLTNLASLKGQALLCYLAVTRRPHSRAALNQYEVMRRVLEIELGVAPEAESQALYEQIRSGALSDKVAR